MKRIYMKHVLKLIPLKCSFRIDKNEKHWTSELIGLNRPLKTVLAGKYTSSSLVKVTLFWPIHYTISSQMESPIHLHTLSCTKMRFQLSKLTGIMFQLSPVGIFLEQVNKTQNQSFRFGNFVTCHQIAPIPYQLNFQTI